MNAFRSAVAGRVARRPSEPVYADQTTGQALAFPFSPSPIDDAHREHPATISPKPLTIQGGGSNQYTKTIKNQHSTTPHA
jgi:hypothetical protein